MLMLRIYGWLLIGLSFTAVVHMLGSSVLFIKSFQREQGLRLYGLAASSLAFLALLSGVGAGVNLVYLCLTAVLAFCALSELFVLTLPAQAFRYRQIWLSSNSAVVALLAFLLAQQMVQLVGNLP